MRTTITPAQMQRLEQDFMAQTGTPGILLMEMAAQAVVEAVRDTVVRMQNGNGIKAEDIPPIVDELIPQQLLVSAYRKYNK